MLNVSLEIHPGLFFHCMFWDAPIFDRLNRFWKLVTRRW